MISLNSYLLAFFLLLSSCTAIANHKWSFQKTSTSHGKERELKNLVATATVSMEQAGGMHFKGKAVIIASREDRFRMEFLGPFNQIISVLSFDGINLSLLEKRNGLLYRWPLEGAPYPLSGKGVASYLMGLSPRLNSDVRHLKDKMIISKGKEGQIKGVTIYQHGKRRVRVEMDRYKPISGHPIPFFISILSDSGYLTINYKEVDLNMDIKDVDFHLITPEGVKEIFGERRLPL